MSIVFILLGALAVTLFVISRLGLDLPPGEHYSFEVISSAKEIDVRESAQVAA